MARKGVTNTPRSRSRPPSAVVGELELVAVWSFARDLRSGLADLEVLDLEQIALGELADVL
jgi:hypothetical protein